MLRQAENTDVFCVSQEIQDLGLAEEIFLFGL